MRNDACTASARRLTPLRSALTLAVVLVLVTGCRPATPHQEDSDCMHRAYEEAASGSADVAGTYALAKVDTRRIPSAVAVERGCQVVLADGTMDLVADGRYRMSLTVNRVCGDQTEDVQEIVKEGLYSLVGATLRFGDKMLVQNDDPAPEVTAGPEDLLEAVLPDGRLAAVGSVAPGSMSMTLPNLRTLYFVRQDARTLPAATG